MTVTGAEYLEALAAGRAHDATLVFNERGATVFPSRQQHREMKTEGVSYELRSERRRAVMQTYA